MRGSILRDCGERIYVVAWEIAEWGLRQNSLGKKG